MEKREPSYTVGGKVNWYNTMDNIMRFPQKTESKSIIWSSNFTSGVYCSMIHNSQNIYWLLFVIAQCFLYHNLIFSYFNESSQRYEQDLMSPNLKGKKTKCKTCVSHLLFPENFRKTMMLLQIFPFLISSKYMQK